MNALQRFKETYSRLKLENLHLLDMIYAEKIHFVDPAHTLNGLDMLKSYFRELYRNVGSIEFDFIDQLTEGSRATLEWKMKFTHPRLAKNQVITVGGCSWIEFDAEGKAVHHRDYFDLGAMLYEQLPLLGGIVRSIKRRLGQ